MHGKTALSHEVPLPWNQWPPMAAPRARRRGASARRPGHQGFHAARTSIAVVPLLMLGLLCGCSGQGLGTNQRGPLRVGSDAGPPENILCVLQLKTGETIGLGETISNPSEEPVEILSVELIGSHNLRQTGAKAWPVVDIDAVYYWSDAEPEFSGTRMAAGRPNAQGFILEPSAVANVAALAVLAQAGQKAGAHQLVVRYATGGRRYAELTNITYELEPDGCE